MTSTPDDRALLLTPKSVGELLSDAVQLLRTLFRPLLLAALPFCVTELFLREGGNALSSRALAALGPDGAGLAEQGSEILALMGGYFALLLGSIAVTQILGAGATVASSSALFGQRLGAPEIVRLALKRTGAVLFTLVLWLAALGLLITLPGALLFGAAFLGAGAGVLVALVVLWGLWAVGISVVLGLRWALWLQVVVLEGLSGPAALSRSSALMASRGGGLFKSPKLRLGLLLFIYLVIASSLQSLFALPLLIRGFSQTPPFSDLSLWNMPVAWIVPLAAVQVATNAVVMPLNGIVTSLFYFDLRVRYEGFDLGDDEEAARR